MPIPANQQASSKDSESASSAVMLSQVSVDQQGKEVASRLTQKHLIFFLVIGSFLLLGSSILFLLSRQQGVTPVVRPTPSSTVVQQEQIPGTVNTADAATLQGSLRVVGTDVQWQDAELSYDVQQVYALGNLSPQIIPELPLEQQLVVFAIQVTDTRTFGAARVVPARSFVNIRRQSQDFPPLGEDTVQLEPGQSTTLYVPFAVPKTELQVLGLLGNLRNPYVVDLDFSQAEQLEGSLDLLTGFKSATSSAEPNSIFRSDSEATSAANVSTTSAALQN